MKEIVSVISFECFLYRKGNILLRFYFCISDEFVLFVVIFC